MDQEPAQSITSDKIWISCFERFDIGGGTSKLHQYIDVKMIQFQQIDYLNATLTISVFSWL